MLPTSQVLHTVCCITVYLNSIRPYLLGKIDNCIQHASSVKHFYFLWFTPMALTLFKLLSQAILTLTVLQTKFTKSLLLSQFCSVAEYLVFIYSYILHNVIFILLQLLMSHFLVFIKSCEVSGNLNASKFLFLFLHFLHVLLSTIILLKYNVQG
jgi:hypothetical protein